MPVSDREFIVAFEQLPLTGPERDRLLERLKSEPLTPEIRREVVQLTLEALVYEEVSLDALERVFNEQTALQRYLVELEADANRQIDLTVAQAQSGQVTS